MTARATISPRTAAAPTSSQSRRRQPMRGGGGSEPIAWVAVCGSTVEPGRVLAPGRAAAPVSTARRCVASRESRSEEHTSELQSLRHLVCRLLLEKKKKNTRHKHKH